MAGGRVDIRAIGRGDGTVLRRLRERRRLFARPLQVAAGLFQNGDDFFRIHPWIERGSGREGQKHPELLARLTVATERCQTGSAVEGDSGTQPGAMALVL